MAVYNYKLRLMYQHHDNIYCSFPPFNAYAPKSEKIRTLIMGHTGNGKTLFINKACNKMYSTKMDVGSVTRDIIYEDVAFFPAEIFRIYDTPGTDSQTNATEHAMVLRASLTKIPFNLIMIQAKLDTRYQKSLTEFKDQVRIFKGYEKLVVFMISHLDIIKDKQREEVIKKLGETIIKFKIKASIVLYSNMTSQFQVLCNILYCLGRMNEQKVIQIDDDVFYKYFNISSPIKSSLKTDEIQQVIQEMEDKARIFVKFFRELSKDQPDINDVISSGKQYMNYQLKKLQKEQYEQYSQNLNEFETTDLYLMLSQFIQSKLEEVDSIADLKIKKVFYEDNYKKEIDPTQMFKQCPNCKKIWMKIQGCNGLTHCGSRPNVFDYYLHRQSQSYIFEIDKNQVKAKKNTKVKTKIGSISGYKLEEKEQEYGTGCGTELNWGSLPKIENIQQILRGIYGVSNFQSIRYELEKLTSVYKEVKINLELQVQKTMKTIAKDLQSQEKNQN